MDTRKRRISKVVHSVITFILACSMLSLFFIREQNRGILLAGTLGGFGGDFGGGCEPSGADCGPDCGDACNLFGDYGSSSDADLGDCYNGCFDFVLAEPCVNFFWSSDRYPRLEKIEPYKPYVPPPPPPKPKKTYKEYEHKEKYPGEIKDLGYISLTESILGIYYEYVSSKIRAVSFMFSYLDLSSIDSSFGFKIGFDHFEEDLDPGRDTLNLYSGKLLFNVDNRENSYVNFGFGVVGVENYFGWGFTIELGYSVIPETMVKLECSAGLVGESTLYDLSLGQEWDFNTFMLTIDYRLLKSPSTDIPGVRIGVKIPL